MYSIILDGAGGNIVVMIIGAFICAMVGITISGRSGRALLIYAWHTAFAIIYIRIIQDIGGDAIGYYQRAISNEFEWVPGTKGVNALTAFFVSDLGLSFTGVSLVFALAGAVGLILLDHVLARITIAKPHFIRWIASLIVFLPSASFWSVGLGKDSIAMLASGLFVYAAMVGRRQMALIGISIAIMFWVRPHVAALMGGAVVVGTLFAFRRSWLSRAGVGVVALGVAVVAAPFIFEYIGIGDDLSQEAIEERLADRQNANLGGGSSVDIASMTPAMRVFTYMFRPMLYEAGSLFALLGALENTLFLLIIIYAVWSYVRGPKLRAVPLNTISLLTFSGMAIIVLSQTTANLGIAARQKWMILPALLTAILHLFPDIPSTYAYRRRPVWTGQGQ